MNGMMKELDLRPLLRNGIEPFPAIMETVASLAPGEGLMIMTTFRPVPLFNVMARRGFDHVEKDIGNGEWEVQFIPQKKGEELSVSPTLVHDAAEPEAWPDPSEYLDLADLPPPLQIKRLIESTKSHPPGSVIFAVMQQEPVFLYADLMANGHQWAGNFDENRTAFRMFIRVGLPPN